METQRHWRSRCIILLLVGVLLAGVATARAQMPAPNGPVLHTGEAYVKELSQSAELDVKDPMAVFAYVFSKLSDEVKVFPTENYYYFSFIYNGVPYDGNIRLDASNRDQGKVDFAYSEDLEEWREEETPVEHLLLDASQGVAVEKIERFVYRISFRGKSVRFVLNDLSNVKPLANTLRSDEKYIGPIFDESGVRYFLVYNKKLKVFHYILDETVESNDELEPRRGAKRILIGKRTGFAYYRDHHLDRKILIGVFEGNYRINNYFDGPFDQLPDNFIEGDTLRGIFLDLEPGLKGHIDRFGGSPDGKWRYDITPYLPYETQRDLDIFDRCARHELRSALYYRCFDADMVGAKNGGPRRGTVKRGSAPKSSLRRRQGR